MSDWLKQNSSPLILLALVIIMLIYSLHVMHAKDVDDTTLAWARENTGLVLGGLLSLLTAGSKMVPRTSAPAAPEAAQSAPPTQDPQVPPPPPA